MNRVEANHSSVVFQNREVNDFLNKMQLPTTAIYFSNRNREDVHCTIRLRSEGKIKEITRRVLAYRDHIISNETGCLVKVKLEKRCLYLIPNYNEYTGKLEISISPQWQATLPRFMPSYSIVLPQEIDDEDSRFGSFVAHFNKQIRDTEKCILPYEKIDPCNFYLHRLESYSKRFSRIRETNEKRIMGNLSKDSLLIPLYTHHIWLTDLAKPKELDSTMMDWMVSWAKKNKTVDGWEHYLWVQDLSKLPRTVTEIKKRSKNRMQVKELAQFFSIYPTLQRKQFDEFMRSKEFAKASDTLRCLLLQQIGGLYADNDTYCFQSFTALHYAFDSYAGQEPVSSYIGNAIIAAKPSHPMIAHCLDLIDRNTRSSAPAYILNQKDPLMATVYQTGPLVLSLAFEKAFDPSRQDIIFPTTAFYPAKERRYPVKDVLVPGNPAPASSWCVHFWSNTWIKDAFEIDAMKKSNFPLNL